jgi:hypothetical protein
MSTERCFWFFRLVDKKSDVPSERLLAVFSVTEQLLVSTQFKGDFSKLPFTIDELKVYLTDTAISAKANRPSDLSEQLLILLMGAIAEQTLNPETQAVKSAIAAAQMVIKCACEHKRYDFKLVPLFATLVICASTAIAWLDSIPNSTESTVAFKGEDDHYLYKHPDQGHSINQDLLITVFNLNEKIQQGICPAPHLLDIPEAQMIAYMNVTNYRLSQNPAADKVNLQAFVAWYEQEIERECSYPRKGGFATVNWRK